MRNFITHFHTHFEITNVDESADTISDYIVKEEVGNWLYSKIKEKSKNKKIIDHWLFRGGAWDSDIKGTSILSNNAYIQDNYVTRFWALRFDHRDGNHIGRKWRTDIGITETEDKVAHFSITTLHFTDGDYLGEEPPLPPPNSPNLVKSILNNKKFRCSSGMSKLKLEPTILKPGDGRWFIEELQNPYRDLPYVVLKYDPDEKSIPDPNKISQNLAGNVKVFLIQSLGLEEEMKYYFKGDVSLYKCPWNGIRIYKTKLNSSYSNDFKRHRFFKFGNYSENYEKLIEILSKGLQKSTIDKNFNGINNLEELSIKLNQLKIKQFQNSRNTENEKEYINLLEEENSRLTELENKLKIELAETEELFDQISSENSDLDKEVQNLKETYTSSHIELQKAKQEITKKDQFLSNFNKLPLTLFEISKSYEILFPTRIKFLQEAFESAELFEVPLNELNNVWSLFWAICNELYDLYFNTPDQVNIPHLFKNKTGFDITLSESSLTKSDNRLMRGRKRLYKDEEVDILSHLKLDKSKMNLRIHYHVDNEYRIIVIGHCGNHLETAGTKRRKEG